MITSEKISAKKNSKRERIIEAASVLFSERNFHEVMMTDVAQKASIAKGTLYNYYNSKEDLYFSVMLIRMQNLISSLQKKIRNETTALASLHTYVIHNYMFLMKYQCFFRMYQRENLNASNIICEELRSKNAELREILYNILCEGVRVKSFRIIDQNLITDLILGGIFAAVSKGIRDNYSADLLARERENIYNFIINGLLNEPDRIVMEQRRILITRSEDEAHDFTRQVSGSEIIFFPTIEIVPSTDNDLFRQIAESLIKSDYLILTSANSVRVLSEKFLESGISPDYSKVIVAAVGNKTALECEKYSVPVHRIPEKYSAVDLADLFSSIDLNGKRVIIPGSSLSGDALPNFFERSGARVQVVNIYNVQVPDKEKVKDTLININNIKPDIFVFTSPSSFRNYLELVEVVNPEEYFRDSIIAAIGDTTKTVIAQHNVNVTILPQESSLAGLGRSVGQYIK